MACISSANFAVLINGVPFKFFKISRGIREGYYLSPFLFLPVSKALSKLLSKAKKDNLVKGIKVTEMITLSHLLFVYHVLIFGIGEVGEWKVIKYILHLLCNATSMEISIHKSIFLTNELNDELKGNLSTLLAYK